MFCVRFNNLTVLTGLAVLMESALIIEKTMKKIFKKKIISDLPTLIFSRYETGTTGIFFHALSVEASAFEFPSLSRTSAHEE
jgi:hypothetical protein